ncbi:ASCH domain-containing protein [Amycolatopsis sp. NPDC021455]|uniref:ASCH domain-containing protein n=1 Tax=Amycolatopsis sp. NPDC021455 TaxID=3154901 RepID=UPI00340A5F8F
MSERRTTPTMASGAPEARPLVLSLRPRFAEAILDGSKTVELRRTRLQAPAGTRLVLYAASPVMAVVGVATLEAVESATPNQIWRRHRLAVGLDRREFDAYFADAQRATALIISSPQRLAEPPDLATMRAETGFRPPQSYRYLTPVDPQVLHLVAAD